MGSIEHHKAQTSSKRIQSTARASKYLEIFSPTIHMSTLKDHPCTSGHRRPTLMVNQHLACISKQQDGARCLHGATGRFSTCGSPNELVCLLDKELYGAKQGGRHWNNVNA